METSLASHRSTKPALLGLLMFFAAMGSPSAQSQGSSAERAERFRRMSQEAEARGLAEPFKGITKNGQIMPGLFAIRSTGVSTEPVRQAAAAFLASLSSDQRAKTLFPVDDDEWRKWMNPHFYVRQGVSLAEMSEAQRQAALDLLRASLSAKGLQQSQDIMRLNHTLGELNGSDFEQYGEGRYWITLMGEPHASEPWGWQLDGHHLVINYFVLGDQVVMTPTFMGSEPVTATAGKYKGAAVLQREQNKGLALINTLDEAQRQKAIIKTSKQSQNNVTEAFKDNVVLDYAGIRATDLSPAQKDSLLELIQEHVGNLRDGHARVKMDEVHQHLDETHFAWIGETKPDSIFYYRVQSPVILIEFDHQPPINMAGVERGKPTRQHIHSVVRTPNGNDYGKDLLRQHYQQHPHPHRH
jgi:predicted nuclease of restriction endonuclease-like (RecB) superfamily